MFLTLQHFCLPSGLRCGPRPAVRPGVACAACRVDSQQFNSQIASLPLVSLLFIVIPTPFLNFYLFLVHLYSRVP